MATDVDQMNFGNKWFAPAAAAAARFALPSGRAIRLITGPFFLATKLAAFESRGQGDYVLSHDLEDLISVIDGRRELLSKVSTGDETTRRFVVERFAKLVRDRAFVEALPGHLPGDDASQARLPELLSRIRSLAEI